MSTRIVTDVPKCDLCQNQYDVVFDAPTTFGCWAYQCEACLLEAGHEHYQRAMKIGTRLQKQDAKLLWEQHVPEEVAMAIQAAREVGDGYVKAYASDSVLTRAVLEGDNDLKIQIQYILANLVPCQPGRILTEYATIRQGDGDCS